ncbi:MAG: GrpB family protein [Minisyncoccales bacterium]
MRKAKIIGLQRGKVKLSPYVPEWKRLYKKEEKLLCSSIGKYIEDIQHVGSTSIPGVKSKPIIDIAIGVKSLRIGRKCIKPLEKLGYEYKGDAGIAGRHFFAKGSKMNRIYYIHIEKLNDKLWKNHIVFRDYLRRHKEAIKEYNKLKEKLAKEHKDDRDTYTIKKATFIQRILRKAKAG